MAASEMKVPSMYLVAEKDRAVPVKVQERMVAAVPGMQSLRVPCGHSPFLSHPVETVEVIVKGAELQGGLKASI
jgi:pimeloyl-ACP methyl ester carboxylesterase